jgi:hypothetical protein
VSEKIEGVWAMELYVVGGKETALDGVLFMTAGQWATLYFVPGDHGAWGSAEAGDYGFDGQTLNFFHRLLFQGGGGREVQIDLQENREERCTVAFDGDRLTIRFPSGNDLHLRRTAP